MGYFLGQHNPSNYFALTFQIVHSRYPLGVCVRKDIHLLYHSIYSKCVNTEDQWNLFVVDFKNGVYDDQIKIA